MGLYTSAITVDRATETIDGGSRSFKALHFLNGVVAVMESGNNE